MPLLTLVGRVQDAMPLSGTQDSHPDLAEFQRQARLILKSINRQSPARQVINSPPFVYYYLIENSVCYICCCDQRYPSALAFQYLEAVHNSFQERHGHEVNQFSRPYAAFAFDSHLTRLRKDYLDPRSHSNLEKLNRNLGQIHHVMRSNMEDLMIRGEKLEDLDKMSSDLKEISSRYAKDAKWANLTAMWKAWSPFIVLAAVLIIILYFRFG